MTKALGAVPALARLSIVALPVANVKSILPCASSATMVFPASYASWSVTPEAFAGHCTISLVILSRHNVVARFAVTASEES